jgi:ubiquinone/menaquinone biosynthesis C-methylase UbiE
MLPRVLEPEVMDSPEEARDYDAMDHAEVNRLFVADFLAFWGGRGNVLDVGTGTAQIPVELCRRAEHLHVVGIDLAEHMLRVGRDNVSRSGLAERIRLERVDAKRMPFAGGQFSAIISNSIVHHIPQPGDVLAEMSRVVRASGAMFVRDLLRPSDEATLHRLVNTYAAEANDHQQRMFRESLQAALTLAEVRILVMGIGYGPETVQQTSDRHWTWRAFRP